MASVELVSKSVQTENNFMKMIEEINCLKEDNKSVCDYLLATKSHKYNLEFAPIPQWLPWQLQLTTGNTYYKAR